MTFPGSLTLAVSAAGGNRCLPDARIGRARGDGWLVRIRIVAMAVVLLMGQPAVARAQAPIADASIAIGLGAIAGVAAVNALALGAAAFPGAYVAGAVVPAEMAVAINRFYAVTSGVVGAWAGEYLVTRGSDAPVSASTRLTAAAIGAMAGVSAFSLATARLGSVPWAARTVQAVPVSVMVGSRMVAAASAGAGALAGAWLNGVRTGEPADLRYGLALIGGAMAGVAAFNLATVGEIGVVPSYANANAPGPIASAAATGASRIAAVVAGTAGALLAGRWYGSPQ
jgi:hypothetical protein